MLIFTLALLLAGLRALLALLAAVLLAEASLPRLAGFAFAVFPRAFARAFPLAFDFDVGFDFDTLDLFATDLSSHQIDPTVNAGAASALR